MASRPVFIPNPENEGQLVITKNIEFKWTPGMAKSQKQKNIQALHDSAKQQGIQKILEVSSKSMTQNGTQLSALLLEIETVEYGKIFVESAFQGGKVFSNGTQFTDLFFKTGYEAKTDQRTKDSGPLKAFKFGNVSWSLNPPNAFYDYIYISALHQNKNKYKYILEYDGFTDIEFNPKKSINSQSHACAAYTALTRRGFLEKALTSKSNFLAHYNQATPNKQTLLSLLSD